MDKLLTYAEVMLMIFSEMRQPISKMVNLSLVNRRFNVLIEEYLKSEYKKSFLTIERIVKETRRIRKVINQKYNSDSHKWDDDVIEVSAGELLDVDVYDREASMIFVTDEQLSVKRVGIYYLVAIDERGLEFLGIYDL